MRIYNNDLESVVSQLDRAAVKLVKDFELFDLKVNAAPLEVIIDSFAADFEDYTIFWSPKQPVDITVLYEVLRVNTTPQTPRSFEIPGFRFVYTGDRLGAYAMFNLKDLVDLTFLDVQNILHTRLITTKFNTAEFAATIKRELVNIVGTPEMRLVKVLMVNSWLKSARPSAACIGVRFHGSTSFRLTGAAVSRSRHLTLTFGSVR